MARCSMDLWPLVALLRSVFPGEEGLPLAAAQTSMEQAMLALAVIGVADTSKMRSWGFAPANFYYHELCFTFSF